MKKLILICVLTTFLIPAWAFAGVIGPARIKLADGDIMFRTPDAGEWLPAAVNTPLDEGDAVWCPNGAKAEIQLADGTMVRLDGGSQLDLLANEDGFTHLHLASGRLYLRTAQTSTKNSLQIDADDTTVLPEARTRLRLDMLPNSQEDVAILKGAAYVEGGGNRTRVRAGEHIILEDGHNELLSLNPPDSWEHWNTDRDRAQSRSARAESNLPDELRSHSSELDANGTWVRVPEYGMVWRPNVVAYDDWAPYRSGRWIWKGSDYVWLSFESWGWVPYHFGRWAVLAGFGWCWVPPLRGDVYWSPGYVGWYRTGSHIGWTPLAPGEIFYGHGHYGRHSVNITNTTINTSTVIYRNRDIRGGMTVLPHNDFLRGRTAPQRHSASPNVSVSISVGSPRIQPQRETRMPIVKQIPPKVAPPRVEHQDNRELRQRFQRITPQSEPQRGYQQLPASSAPPISAVQTAPAGDKRVVHPAAPQQASPSYGTSQPRIEQHQQPRTGAPAATAPQATPPAPQRGVLQSRPEPIKRELKQKRVWKVTSPEDPKEKVIKEKDHGGKEIKGR
ncbi:MAG: FecR domain-containing protein [Deltaproteobacteria bacterium]|nr:FecR domain-containing protein [Deltaproteobacteria bacterium]